MSQLQAIGIVLMFLVTWTGIVMLFADLRVHIDNVCKPDQTDIYEALSLLDLAIHQGEYGVGEDVRNRYEALKERCGVKR